MLGRGVTLQELRAFMVAARLGSFTKAADQLGLTQPGLSMAVRQLESKLGTNLFDRSRRFTQLSPVGAALLPSVERLVENFDHTLAGMIDVSRGKQGRVAVACPEGVAAKLIAPALRAFVQHNPGVAVSLFDGDATSVEHLMHARVADFGVTGFWKPHPDFTAEPLASDFCCVICPRDHPFAAQRSVPLAALDGLPIVALNRDAGVRRLVDRICNGLGIRLAVQFEVARVSTLVEMVASGICVSVLTDLSMLQRSMPQLVAVPLEGPELSYPISVILPANRMLTPSAASFLQALRQHVEGGHSYGLGRRAEAAKAPPGAGRPRSGR